MDIFWNPVVLSLWLKAQQGKANPVTILYRSRLKESYKKIGHKYKIFSWLKGIFNAVIR